MNTVTPQNCGYNGKTAPSGTVAERLATCTGACAHLHDDQEQKGGYPDTYRTRDALASWAGLPMTSATPTGERYMTGC